MDRYIYGKRYKKTFIRKNINKSRYKHKRIYKGKIYI